MGLWATWSSGRKMSLLIAGGLDWMTFKAPLQSKLFYDKVCLLLGFFMSPFYKGIFTKSRAILDRFIYKSLKRLYSSFSDHLNFLFAHHYFLPCQWLKENRQIQLLPRYSVSHFDFFIWSLTFCSNKYLLPDLLLVTIPTMQWLKQTLPVKYLNRTESCNCMKLFCCSHLARK